MSFTTISVIGLGYIGLSMVATSASHQKYVIGVNVDQHAVDAIDRGEVHIIEPSLGTVMKTTVENGFLCATTTPVDTDAYLIAVPTPFKGEHEPDMAYVGVVAKSLTPVLKGGTLTILKLTLFVGAIEQMTTWLAEVYPGLTLPQQAGEHTDVNIAYCLGRILPGQAMVELIKSGHVIEGMTSVHSTRTNELYNIFLEGECVVTSTHTTEMRKLTENSSRDVSIAFVNGLPSICADQGINVWGLIRLANRYPRMNILQPGPGVGGHCVTVDLWSIVVQNLQQVKLIRTAHEVNDGKSHWMVDQAKATMVDRPADTDKQASEVKIVCFGPVFKPNIDDLRESPAVGITQNITHWHKDGILVVEPNIHHLPKELDGSCQLVVLDDTLASVDMSVLLVDYSEFKVIRGDAVHQQYTVDVERVWHQ